MTPPRYIYPEDYLTPEMAKLARALRFVDDKQVKAFRSRELHAIRTAGMRMHYEVLGHGQFVISKLYGCSQQMVSYYLRRAGVKMRPKLKYYGKLRIFRLGIDQVLQAVIAEAA